MSNDQDLLLAATGRRCINPPPNIAHGGWGAQRHEQAEGIDLDFWLTALALSDGKTTAVILDIDLQILTNERADQVRREVSRATGLPIEHIRASVTHTHSGPVPYRSWIEKGYEMVGPWFEDVARWAGEVATEAVTALQPVAVRTGTGRCAINTNRRCVTESGERFLGVNAAGLSDHEVRVIQMDSPNGQPVATVAHYPCHGTIMGPYNKLLTPDFPGPMRRVVEAAVGGRCVFLQGAAGNQGPVQGFQADTKVYRGLGAILGHEVAKIALETRFLPSKLALREVVPSGAPLGMYDPEFSTAVSLPLRLLEKEISVPVREGLPDRNTAAQKLEFWKEKLRAARESHAESAAVEAIYMARRADIELRMADDFAGKKTADIRTHFITFGDFALVGCNVEPFCEIGMALKRLAPFPATCLSGYTNGRLAYMPTAEEWARGGYEVENSPFGQNAAAILQAEILSSLKRLRDSD